LTESYVSIGRYYADAFSAQDPVAVAVIIPSILRPTLGRAVQSVYEQDLDKRIQIVIGIDVAEGNLDDFEPVFAARPPNISILVMALPYSTSARHGGVHFATDCGALRTILSYVANAQHVAYLDDDNTWLPFHLRHLFGAIQGKVWASGQRILVDEDTDQHLGVDIWDSVGPNRGRFKKIGGFIDTNCLMVDKHRVGPFLGNWSIPLDNKPGLTGDRHFFKALSGGSYNMVMVPTVLYRIRRTNIMWEFVRGNIWVDEQGVTHKKPKLADESAN